ncbi:unnamed protein product [Adineta steineri]|uniref:Uncharacterized protein n=1 Tax=Adineta steineri TaxID=433720 RepID=A0A814EEX3_9BILA|nr:unnamed protein product [Adineta steineri]
MTMYGNFISLIFLSILISSNGQYHDDERDLPPATYAADRSSKSTFDTQFSRGRCPERFYQSGEECLYFATDGKIYNWPEVERVCSRRIARMLNKHSSSDMYQQNQNKPHLNQPNMTPTKGVRQLVLNTPEKTEIFRALFREYNEQNFAIRLPSDYNTLRRCHNIKDDKWPQYCINPKYSNATCFETVSNGPNDVCVREVECKQRYLRVACEFTLPGSPEITNSKFQNCPIVRGLRHRLPLWAWILIAVGVAVLLAIIVAIVVFVLKSKKNSSGGKRSLPPPREKELKNIGHTTETTDPAARPMLNRPPVPNRPTDTGYLQPRKSLPDNNSNA